MKDTVTISIERFKELERKAWNIARFLLPSDTTFWITPSDLYGLLFY